MAPICIIAIIQFRPKPLAVEENFALSASYIRHAASQGADIAVLPEYHLTSWCPDESGFIQACRDSMPYLSKYQALSFELGIHIVPGTICEVHPSSSSSSSSSSAESATNSGPSKDEIEIRNMTYFICPTPTLDKNNNNKKEGTIKGTYQKKNLWHPERPHLTAAPLSSPHESFDVPSLGTWPGSGTGTETGATPIKVGLLICWDAIFPEAFRPLVQTGADLIIIPAFWLLDEDFGETSPSRTKRAQEAEKKLIESLITTRAYENTCTVVFVNAGGGSQVAGASVLLNGQDDDEKSAMMGIEEEGVKLVAVDLGEDRKLEGRYKIREDLMRALATEKNSIVMKPKEVERGNMG